MSSRLVILPKKSYCPWKPENVERVLRDERLHREEQERNDERERKAKSEGLIEALKRQRQTTDEVSGAAVDDNEEQSERFSLFEAEERAHLEQAARSISLTGAHKGKQSAIMPVFLDESKRRDRKRQRRPYLRIDSLEPKARDEREEARKRALDPMADVASSSKRPLSKHESKKQDDVSESGTDAKRHASRKKRSRHSSRKRSARKKSSRTNSDSTSIQELRRRRLDREQSERQREQQLVKDSTSLETRRASKKYSDQYNPNLSRR